MLVETLDEKLEAMLGNELVQKMAMMLELGMVQMMDEGWVVESVVVLEYVMVENLALVLAKWMAQKLEHVMAQVLVLYSVEQLVNM